MMTVHELSSDEYLAKDNQLFMANTARARLTFLGRSMIWKFRQQPERKEYPFFSIIGLSRYLKKRLHYIHEFSGPKTEEESSKSKVDFRSEL